MRRFYCAAALGVLSALIAPAGLASAQDAPTQVPIPADPSDPAEPNGADGTDDPSSKDLPALLGEHPDGGERVMDYLDEVMREATPEELERRRTEISERLEEAGSATELARRIEQEANAALAELDTTLAAAQEKVASSSAESTEATAARERAEDKHRGAERRARDADGDMRRAAVDLFINPPQADTVRAALAGTVEEEMASTGLLVGRAETRRQLSLRKDRARAEAAKAERSAEAAAEKADVARTEAEAAATALSSQLELRNEELRRIREDLFMLELEIADLELTDKVLETRLALDALSRAGSVAAVQGPDGNWVPLTDGLPTRADMAQIQGTSLWVHNLVASSVVEMVAAAAEDGVTLGGSSYRDSQRQIQLRASHCGNSYEAVFTMSSSSCSPPTARPGQSMHERGLAIDFTEGGRVLTRSSPSFVWLSEHAAEFGFFNLPSEPWHWSVNGR